MPNFPVAEGFPGNRLLNFPNSAVRIETLYENLMTCKGLGRQAV